MNETMVDLQGYVDEVRRELADLPEDARDELTDGLTEQGSGAGGVPTAASGSCASGRAMARAQAHDSSIGGESCCSPRAGAHSQQHDSVSGSRPTR